MEAAITRRGSELDDLSQAAMIQHREQGYGRAPHRVANGTRIDLQQTESQYDVREGKTRAVMTGHRRREGYKIALDP